MECQGLSPWERWHCVSNDGEGEDGEDMITVNQVYEAMQAIAPLELAEHWDNPGYLHVLDESGDLYSGKLVVRPTLSKVLSGVRRLISDYKRDVFALTEDGAAWAAGVNGTQNEDYNGTLGIGDTKRHTSDWCMVAIGDRIKDIYGNGDTTRFLTETGDLYVAGQFDNNGPYAEPKLILQNVDHLQGFMAILKSGTEYVNTYGSSLPESLVLMLKDVATSTGRTVCPSVVERTTFCGIAVLPSHSHRLPFSCSARCSPESYA